MNELPRLEEFTHIISSALTAFFYHDQDKLLAALQIADPDKRSRAIMSLLAQTQTDSSISKHMQQIAAQLETQLDDPAWWEYLNRQIALPHKSALFATSGDANKRRQILRWLIHSQESANEHVTAVLRTALEDPDWEVRITAVFAAARLNARELGPLIQKVNLPRTSREGLDRTEQSMLRALRNAALALLAGQQPPADTQIPPTTRETMQAHLLRCVAGLPVKWHDRVFLRVLSLTQPVMPFNSPGPQDLPPGVTIQEGCYYLTKTKLELVWVPPVPHWLGAEADELGKALPNPIRQVIPETGFFISRWPIDRDLTRQINPGSNGQETEGGGMDYHTCSWSKAQELCASLSQYEDLIITLPTTDEWEMAARGPDGRRFSWGNGLEHDAQRLASPWGGQVMMGIMGQWTSTLVKPGQPIVCGGPDQPHCALRRIVTPDASDIGFRPVIRLTK